MTDYLNGFHYENQRLMFFANSEGYVNIRANSTNGITAVNYVYNYTDHLGNIRVSYTFRNATGQPVIMEENHYYPFGLKHKKYGSVDKDLVCVDEDCYEVGIDVVPPGVRKPYQYKYNGKEFQDELNLNVYDYGARMYMPDIGRWGQIDPLAEQSRRWTPYNYAYNNPVYFIDPDGMQAVSSDPIKKIISSSSQGNIKPVNTRTTPTCLLCRTSTTTVTPTSHRSSTGTSTEYSKMQDSHSTLYKLFSDGGTSEYIHSVTLTETSVTSQYFDSDGNKVDNISDASTFSVTTKVVTTTIDISETEILDSAKVETKTTTSTYDVQRKPNSELQRGYELKNEKTNTQSKTSTMKSNTVDSSLQKEAKNAVNENNKGLAKDGLKLWEEVYKPYKLGK